MAKLELLEVPEARASVHGELLAMLKELQPNDSNCFTKENQIRTNPSKIQVLKNNKLSMD